MSGHGALVCFCDLPGIPQAGVLKSKGFSQTLGYVKKLAGTGRTASNEYPLVLDCCTPVLIISPEKNHTIFFYRIKALLRLFLITTSFKQIILLMMSIGVVPENRSLNVFIFITQTRI